MFLFFYIKYTNIEYIYIYTYASKVIKQNKNGVSHFKLIQSNRIESSQ